MHALYVGLTAPKSALHIPLIEIIPKQVAAPPKNATHIIITSKTCATLLQKLLPNGPCYISVGKATTACLQKENTLTARNECQEGIIEILEELKPVDPFFFYPHSNLSRPLLKDYLDQMGYTYREEIIYETRFKAPESTPDFTKIGDIYFTSPSTVDAFFHFFGKPLDHINLHTIGYVTEQHLNEKKLHPA